MGLLDRLFNRTKRATGLAVNYGNPAVYEHINTDKAVTEGYLGNTAVYAIVNKDAQKFAAVPQYLYNARSEEDEIIENDLSKLLQRPNEYQGSDAFREQLRAYRKLTGEAFIWLNRGILAEGLEGIARMAKPVLEMYILPSDQMLIVPDPENVYGVLGYILDLGGTQLKMAKEDVIHWKGTSLEFDASNRTHMRGVSPLSSGYKTLQQNNSATDAAVRMYQNDGAKGVLFNESFDALDPVQKQDVRGVVNKRVNNSDVKGAVATLPGKWGYLDLGKGSTDLDLLEGKKLSMQELCFLFDVPYELFDSETTFANKEQAQKGWLYNSIIPACKQFDDELNRVLLAAFNLIGTAVIRSDFDDLPELREDVAQLVTSLNTAWWITGNEKREWMGFGKITDPTMDEVLLPAGQTPISQVNMDEVARQLDQQGLNE